MKMNYNVSDKPKFGPNLVFAFQQIISIMAATLLVPMIITSAGLDCDPAAALFGAGAGTLVYLLFTKFKSPVFLGSSFTFVGALCAVATQNYGYWGLIIGVAFAALIYVIIALIIKFTGTAWINKVLPPVIIGSILAVIGLSLSGTAASWMMLNGADNENLFEPLYVVIGLFTFAAIVFCSIKGTKKMKLIPFIIGIGAGLVLAIILSAIGYGTGVEGLKICDFDAFANLFASKANPIQWFFDLPKFTLVEAIKSSIDGTVTIDGAAVGNIALIFCPIAIVELSQHISDHKNISNLIETDLLDKSKGGVGLDNTLLGDGIGSVVGALFGGCANTTYGESISCVALSKNASTWTILFAAIGAMVLSFFTPFVAIINLVPKCVMGGACIAMYGFISVSGLQMLKQVDLSDNRNLYPVAAILVIGIGGAALNFGMNQLSGSPYVSITSLALAMIVGVLVNLMTHHGKDLETRKQEFKDKRKKEE